MVRLSLAYLPANTKGNASLFCTDLGTIIASWPAQNASDENTWVLTDGSLLQASKKNTCVPGGTLKSIAIFASNEFTSDQPGSASLALLTCTAAGVCSDTSASGTTGPVETILAPVHNATLFSFHSNTPLPFVDVERGSTSGNPAPTSIELALSATSNAIPPAAKNADLSTLEQFLTPVAPATAAGSAPSTPGAGNAPTTEAGMPFIDGSGKITGEQLFNTKSLTTVADIESLEQHLVVPAGQTLSQLVASNTLSQQWDTGIIDYEQGRYSEAVQELGSIHDAPLAFQAPATFSKKAQAKLSTTSGTSGTSSTPGNGQSNSGAFSVLGIPLLVIGLIASVVALILLFLLVSIRFGRRRVERKRELDSFKEDEERARRRVEGKEQQVPQQYSPSPHFTGDLPALHRLLLCLLCRLPCLLRLLLPSRRRRPSVTCQPRRCQTGMVTSLPM